MKSLSTYNNIAVYHGGTSVVENIDLTQCKSGSDFGIAFYLTTSKKQAEAWARSKRRRSKEKTSRATVNLYNIASFDGLNCKIFNVTDEDWFDFIIFNRLNFSRVNKHAYDVVIGSIADDDTQIVIENYIAGAYAHYGHQAKEMAIQFLEPWKLKNQIALCTPEAVSRISYINHYCL